MAENINVMSDEKLSTVAGGRFLGPTFVYIFQDGDSLPVLAQRFATTVRQLCEINSIQDPKKLIAGMRLLIPQR